ncbi:MAG TPA: hypothetical protein VHH36_01500, partial [Candidatus Thermoplasmatota archaeon]|nr:hypothetical protein [Candidatus Thermoplasmatota archaeon]
MRALVPLLLAGTLLAGCAAPEESNPTPDPEGANDSTTPFGPPTPDDTDAGADALVPTPRPATTATPPPAEPAPSAPPAPAP